METKSDQPAAMAPQFPNITSLNVRITPELFNGTNYKDWAYSARMAIGGSRRLGYIDGSNKEPKKDDPKYSRVGLRKYVGYELDLEFNGRRN